MKEILTGIRTACRDGIVFNVFNGTSAIHRRIDKSESVEKRVK